MPAVEPIQKSEGRQIAVVSPVLDDWDSLGALIRDIAALPELAADHVTIIAVDDGSREQRRFQPEHLSGCVKAVVILRLKSNQSHQRAIALGLAHVYREMPGTMAIVMDSDGEDRPCEIPALLKAHNASPDAIVVARRRKRSEGLQFRMGYFVYKALFLVLTGRVIAFGNFSLIPSDLLPRVLFNANVWNNFAATVLRSRVPIHFLDTERGKRYFGASKMNFTSLVAHGMSAISVFSDIVITRIIIGVALATGLVATAVGGIVVTKVLEAVFHMPEVLIPGFATNVVLSLVNILATLLMIALMVILSLLAGRSQASALPTRLIDDLVDTRETTALGATVIQSP